MPFLAAGKRDHLARLGEGGGSELNGQCPFKRIYFFMDVVPNTVTRLKKKFLLSKIVFISYSVWL